MEGYPVRFRDPVHGFIHLSLSELKLVESRAFRRLRQIKQLALTYLVYPGAMHTRFEHSLGVMELATRAFEAIQEKSGHLLATNLKKIGMTAAQAKALLRATALLHDVGHLPFSHGGDTVLPKNEKTGEKTEHEQVSIALIREVELSNLLQKELYSGVVDHIALLLGEGQLPPELLILKRLISGQFDADRMDYLNRDSLHCGVGYGNFDYLRLLETLRAKESTEGGLELCIDRGGIHTLEAMILARYWMFTQVYFHKTRRIYDIYLRRYLQAWYQNQYANLLSVLDQDDVTVMNDIIHDANEQGGSAERHKYAIYIRERKHHRVVYETSNNADARDMRIAVEIEKRLRQKYEGVDFILDRDARSAVHKFYVKGDEKIGDEFPIYDTISKRFSRISEESSIFEKIPRSFHVIRIYADVPKDHLVDLRVETTEIERQERQVI
jgi:HD superfamily phosphohydrolase